MSEEKTFTIWVAKDYGEDPYPVKLNIDIRQKFINQFGKENKAILEVDFDAWRKQLNISNALNQQYKTK